MEIPDHGTLFALAFPCQKRRRIDSCASAADCWHLKYSRKPIGLEPRALPGCQPIPYTLVVATWFFVGGFAIG